MNFIKTIAAAAALAAVSVPALADIRAVNDGTSEMFLAVGDQNGSFIMDTGVTLNQLLAGATFSQSVASTAWTSYTAADTDLFDGASNSTTGTRWALFVFDGSSQADFSAMQVVTTLGKGLTAANVTFNGNVLQTLYGSNVLVGQNASSTGTHATLQNGTSYNLKGTSAYATADFFRLGSSAKTFIGNKVGDNSALFLINGDPSDGSDGTLKVITQNLGLTASFNGTTVSVAAIPAVPEPTSYALMAAGLAAIGFVARRRRAA